MLFRKSFSYPMGSMALLVAIFSCSLLLAEPSLKRLQPWGAQRGKAFQLKLIGTNLASDAKIVSPLPAAFTPLAPRRQRGRNADQQDADVLLFLAELDAQAEIGLYPIRVLTADGLSNLLLFSVGSFPEVMESESQGPTHRPSNDSPDKSELIEAVPVTVNGTLVGPDRDVYRFQGQKNQSLLVEVEARRAGSALDPVIRLLDQERKQIAMDNDTPALGVDCRLDVSLPADGDYYIVVHDARFSEQEQNFYRLKVGAFAYAQGLFPLGWQRGERTKVELYGGNLPTATRVEVDLTQVDETRSARTVSIPGRKGSLPLPFAVGDLPETVEPAGQQINPLKDGVVVNGRVSSPGEVDWYRLRVNPGEHWLVEVNAADLTTSRLSGVLTISDRHQERLASAGDEIPDVDVFSLISPGRTSADPYIPFRVPEGIHELLISVEDLAQRGGPLFGYRLTARRQPPDFTLSSSTPYANIPQSGTVSVAVTANRRGYAGPIRLNVDGADDDLIVEGGFIPSELADPDNRKVSRRGVLTITAKPRAKSKLRNLSIWGEAVLEDGTVIRRRARGPGLVTEILGGTGVPDPNRRDQQKPFTAPWLGLELPVMVGRAIPARLVVDTLKTIRLVQGMEYDFRWQLVSDDPQVKPPKQVGINTPGAREIRVKRPNAAAEYEKSGVLTLGTTVGTPPATFNAVLSGEVEIQGVKRKLYAPAVTVEVVQGYKIVVPSEGFTINAGRKAELVANIQRDPAFHQPVEIKAENLPPGVACRSTRVPGEEKELRMPCQAKSSAVPGEYTIELTSSSLLAGRDREKVPYRIAPVTAGLVISAAGKTAKVRLIGR